MIRAYISNISPLWPVVRQQALLAKTTPEATFTDILKARDRYAHQPDRLEQRAAMLRPTRRKGGEIVVASLAVLAWTAEDLMECLTLAMARGASVRVLDPDLTIAPGSGPGVLHMAALAFAESKRRDQAKSRGLVGGAVSAAARASKAKDKAETIRAEWALPSEDYPTLTLLEKAGISRNTAKLYLGPRSAAQRIHRAKTKRIKHNGRK